jgi:hypothetical protein
MERKEGKGRIMTMRRQLACRKMNEGEWKEENEGTKGVKERKNSGET